MGRIIPYMKRKIKFMFQTTNQNNQKLYIQQNTKELEEHWVEVSVNRHDPLEGTRPPRSTTQKPPQRGAENGELGRSVPQASEFHRKVTIWGTWVSI